MAGKLHNFNLGLSPHKFYNSKNGRRPKQSSQNAVNCGVFVGASEKTRPFAYGACKYRHVMRHLNFIEFPNIQRWNNLEHVVQLCLQ